jgi:hypothetical protein
MRNPSCLLYGPLNARFEDRPIPTIEDPSDVLVRIAYTGVCGSDVRISILFSFLCTIFTFLIVFSNKYRTSLLISLCTNIVCRYNFGLTAEFAPMYPKVSR